VSPAEQARLAARIAATPPSSVAEWSQRVLTIAVTLMLCAAFLLLQQTIRLAGEINDLQAQVNANHYEQNRHYAQSVLRQCELLRTDGHTDAELRTFGCLP